MYIEASSPRRPNDTARLESPLLGSGDKTCLRFWYHMYGTHINTLNVYQTLNNNALGQPVWRKTGTQGNSWKYAEVTLPSRVPFKVGINLQHHNLWMSLNQLLIFKCTFGEETDNYMQSCDLRNI